MMRHIALGLGDGHFQEASRERRKDYLEEGDSVRLVALAHASGARRPQAGGVKDGSPKGRAPQSGTRFTTAWPQSGTP